MKRKPTLQDTMEANAKAMRGLCALGGKQMPSELEAPDRKPVKVRAAPTPSDPTQLEAAVIREIAELLGNHPKVLFAVRQNSGAAEIGGVPIWFYRWARRRGVEMTLTDYWGCLTDGRMFAIEAKRRSWTRVSDKREEMQQAFINVVISAGGVGGFAVSGEQARNILDCKQPVSFGE